MARKGKLSTTFRSTKTRPPPLSPSPATKEAPLPAPSTRTPVSADRGKSRRRKLSSRDATARSKWSVYLIVSSTLPRTYVGVTTCFTRRLKQHNGALKGGAKASSAGRPWSLACIIQGFKDRSDASTFESKWKSISRRIPRKKKKDDVVNPLLEHREAALNKVKQLLDCSYLSIKWQSNAL